MVSKPLTATRSHPLTGSACVSGDRLISLLGIVLGAVTTGETNLVGVSDSDDVARTVAAVRALGADALCDRPSNTVQVHGVGLGTLAEPLHVLEMGPSEAALCLLTGLLATHPITSFLAGTVRDDAGIHASALDLLAESGAGFTIPQGAQLPMVIDGSPDPMPIECTVPIPSAIIKATLLLAGLNTPGKTIIVEATPGREDAERLLRCFGADISVTIQADGTRMTSLIGQPELVPATLAIPGDWAIALPLLVAAVLQPGSEVLVQNVPIADQGASPLEALRRMGADLTVENDRHDVMGRVGDIRARGGGLTGTSIDLGEYQAIDEALPALMIAAACATGSTVIAGADSLAPMAHHRADRVVCGLKSMNVPVDRAFNEIVIHGGGRPPRGGITVETGGDAWVGMSFLALGTVSEHPIRIDDSASIDALFPTFQSVFTQIGGRID